MLRPMTSDDAEAVLALMDTVWGVPPEETPPGLVRIRHLVAVDAGGAWVDTDEAGAVTGAALAIVRDEVWGLSLLIVDPGRQSAGIGRTLMEAAAGYGTGTRGGIIMASSDHRALRTYFRAGFELRPSLDAKGGLRAPPAADPAVREARWPADRELIDATGRAVRNAGHGPDVGAMLEAGVTVLVHDDGGFAAFGRGRTRVVAGTDERIAEALLRTCMAETGTGAVDFIDARQQWALRILVDAGAELVPAGAVCVRGDVGPMRPYLPSGAYL